MVYRADESHDGDEQQEDAHSDDASDDMDTRHQAEALPPCCDRDEQQPDQLQEEREKLNTVSWGKSAWLQLSPGRSQTNSVLVSAKRID